MRFAGAIITLGICLVTLPAGAVRRHFAHASRVSAAPIPSRVEFLRDVEPILDKCGCSGAQCHGKFGGRGGFQVSLMTLSPEDDYEPLIYGGRGRRVNFLYPEKSMLLQKVTNQLPHAGGQRFAVGSPQYNTLVRWIRAGAPFDARDPRVASLAVDPPRFVLPRAGAKRPLRVVATYTDGSHRDVTSQSVFISTNSAVLDVSQDGVVTGLRWGGGSIVARYLGNVTATFAALPQTRKTPYPALDVGANPIDTLVFDNLKRLKVVPSPPANDYEFLRRVTMDTLGRLPEPDEIKSFVASTAPDKRPKLIDNLLERPEFADYRALRLSDLMRVNPRKLGNGALADRSAALLYEWIHESVAQNKPWDQFVKEIVTAKGSTYQNGPACFYRIERAPNDRMENLGQAFLGVRMSCARCHKHPFDRWTTDDYWNFASFMGKVGSHNGRLADEMVIDYNGGAQTRNESVNGKNRGKVAPLTYLGEKTPAKEAPDMVEALADWMAAPDNHFFARGAVNRLWSYYFGPGVIMPVDDMRATSAESVPGLLEALAAQLVKNNWDIKAEIRLILNSKTYQFTSLPNETNRQDDRCFSHSFARAMPAQALLDMVNQAAGVKENFGEFPERARAVQAALPPNNDFLGAFGESHREFLADLDPKLEPNLVQTLAMINSPYIDNKVRYGQAVPDVVKSTKTDSDMIRELYIRTLCRPPTTEEISHAIPILQKSGDRTEAARDMLWALISSREFYFVH